MVEERCIQRRSGTETSRGADASDYAGMSNDKTGENPVRRKPKVSWGRQFRPGLAGTLPEAERRRGWIAGQYSCATWVVGANRHVGEVRSFHVRIGEIRAGDRRSGESSIREVGGSEITAQQRRLLEVLSS